MTKKELFSNDINFAITALSKFKKSFQGNEKFAFKLIKLDNFKNKPQTLSEALHNMSPIFEKILVKKQIPILKSIMLVSKSLPEDSATAIQELVKLNIKKIKKEPVVIPFSTKEFLYKLEKIKSDINKIENFKASKVIYKIQKESLKLAEKTTDENIQDQKEIIRFLEIILKSSVLKNNEQLKTLIKTSKDRLNKKAVIIPFTRKSFLYDLAKILDDTPNEKNDRIFKLARKLPTSSNSISAYIVKIAKESSDKIAYRLCWPYFASIEHIHPASLGGANTLNNFGGACTRANSARQSIDFTEQLKLCPKTPRYCQKYIDRLLRYKENGTLRKCKISEQYILDFANAVKNESKGQVDLRTTEPWYFRFIYNKDQAVSKP